MAKTQGRSTGAERLLKSRHDTLAAPSHADDQSKGSRLENFAEDLGRLLGTTERKAAEWLSQRQTVVRQLMAIRDKASDLLQQLGSDRAGASARGRKRGPGRPRGRRKKRVMSAEARAKIAAAQLARWARQKRAAKQAS